MEMSPALQCWGRAPKTGEFRRDDASSFVSGHDFSRVDRCRITTGLQPLWDILPIYSQSRLCAEWQSLHSTMRRRRNGD
jgi:hypothetical protein